jgi:hypothetical protein
LKKDGNNPHEELAMTMSGWTAFRRGEIIAGENDCFEPIPVSASAELGNRADLSRLPWASKATISNILGAGYGSWEKLAKADFQKLVRDFHAYGASIGKNLKLGNEIESSHRIARILPAVLDW